ncbi:MAG TPA: hypothetical protein VF123_12715 [Candidatus Sulfotelmatobacter sp.]
MHPPSTYRRQTYFQINTLMGKLLFGCIGCAVFCVPQGARGQTKVTTWHYNNARTSANTSEKVLTPANVNVKTFGKLFTKSVDGLVVGHALYLPDVNIPNKGLYNVVYVATMNDTVYAFDANSGTTSALWTKSLLPSGATAVPVSVQGCSATNAFTQIGIVSTPVIDPSSNTIYVVSSTYENSKVVHRLHALDVTTGTERTASPVVIKGTYTLNGGTYNFVDTHQMNRPGLLLANGNVYVAFGSPSCNGSDQGWIMAYNKTSLLPAGAFDDEPGGSFAAIWQKGAGISADPSGHIWACTGEGGFSPGVKLAISVFKLTQSGNTLTLLDWFTPYNGQALSNNDADLNNGVVILPTQSGSHPYELIAVGKKGTIYLLDRTNLGHFCATCTSADTQIVQELPGVVPATGTPVYWNQRVYFTSGSKVEMYPLNQGILGTPTLSTWVPGGGHAIITANGSNDAVLWNLAGGVLFALDAKSLGLLYRSDQAANGRDKVPALAHFATPIAADGKVFIGTQNSLVVYGLLP